MKLLIALAVVIFCWMLPLGDATTQIDMLTRGAMSLSIVLVIVSLSRELWAVLVAAIETLLVALNAAIFFMWPSETWLVIHYAALQKVAFIIEVLVIMGAGSDGIRLYARDIASRLRAAIARVGHQ